MTTSSFSQITQGGQFPSKEQAPYYYYWPTETGENFDKSSLGNKNGGTSLGEKPLKRQSNVELNKKNDEKKAEEKELEAKKEIQKKTNIKKTTKKTVDQNSKSSPINKTKIYRWLDKKGSWHMTNDIGSVPPEYQDQVLEQSE